MSFELYDAEIMLQYLVSVNLFLAEHGVVWCSHDARLQAESCVSQFIPWSQEETANTLQGKCC